jgi:hypothetical protein
VIDAGPIVITEADIVAFATAHDPQWFHMDAETARRGKFGGVIASGWHTCAIAMRLVADAALHGSEASASPGLAYVKWLDPVRPNDRLTLRAEVLAGISVCPHSASSQSCADISRWTPLRMAWPWPTRELTMAGGASLMSVYTAPEPAWRG